MRGGRKGGEDEGEGEGEGEEGKLRGSEWEGAIGDGREKWGGRDRWGRERSGGGGRVK